MRHQGDQRFERGGIGNPGERARRGHLHLGVVVETTEQRGGRAAVGDTAERGDRGEPCRAIVGIDLLDQQRHDAPAMPCQRLDRQSTRVGVAEQTGQGPIHLWRVQPPQHGDDRRQQRGRGRSERPQQVANPGVGDVRADDVFYPGAGAVLPFRTLVDRRERRGDRRGVFRHVVERSHQGGDDVVFAERAERVDDRRPQGRIGQQRDQARGDAGIVDPCQRVDRGERQEEVPRLDDVEERLHRGGGSQPAQRLDGVEPHVGIGIAERLEERRHRRGVLLIAEREGGLDAQVGVAVLQQRRHRAGDVEVGQRQQFERAAQDAEVAMLVAQRVDQRRHETRRRQCAPVRCTPAWRTRQSSAASSGRTTVSASVSSRLASASAAR